MVGVPEYAAGLSTAVDVVRTKFVQQSVLMDKFCQKALIFGENDKKRLSFKFLSIIMLI